MVVCLDQLDASEEWLWWLPVGVVVLLRFVALQFGWQTPVATGLPAQVGSIVPTPPMPSSIKNIRPTRFIPPLPGTGHGAGHEDDDQSDG